MPESGDFSVGRGVLDVGVKIDEQAISKSVADAGKKAGKGFTKSLADHFKSDKESVTAAGDSGEKSAQASTKGFGSKLAAMGPMLAAAGVAAGAAVGAALVGGVMAAIDKENMQAQMKAKFGLSPEESKTNGALAGKLYAQNFGDSLASVNDAAGMIAQLTGASGKELENLTKQGLTMSKVFGYDVTESLNAAKNMVANGLSPNVTEAFDLIAKGSQVGLNANGDLLESLNEYSSQWAKLGIKGPQAIDLMSQAQKAGIKDTDLLNDAFKEFSIRAVDGSKTTVEAYKTLGLSADATAAAIAKGGPSAQKATAEVVRGLQSIKDPVKQSQTAVALFGTQFEDMGPQIFNALDLASGEFKNTTGTVNGMINDLGATTGAKLETMKRQATMWATNVAGSFLTMATEGVKNFQALWNGQGGDGPFSNLQPIIQKVKALGAIFGEIFNEIKTVVMENKTQFQTFFNFILGISNILWSAVGPIFKALGAAIKAVIGILGGLIDFFAGVFTGDWKRAGDGLHKIWFSLWEGIKGILTNVGQALLNIVKGIWSGIKGTVMGFVNWFVNGWKAAWTGAKNDVLGIGNAIRDGISSRFNTMKTNINNAINNVKSFITGMRDHIGSMLSSIKGKFDSFKTNTIAAFTAAKDGVGRVWAKLQDVAKKPVNFVIDPVYANIRNLWNNIASKVGIKELPAIAKFARGGIAPGVGSRDTVPAMLTPGEGILTKDEMRKIGGPAGFAQLRKEIQYFKDGGIVGWVKDKVGGAVRGTLYKGAKSVADKWIYPFINQMQGGNGFDGLMKGGANKLIGGALDWIKADDKKNAVPAGSSGMGYQNMMKALRSKFPGLGLISGYRPGSRTLSGNTSYHASGRAVDVAPRRDVAQFIYDNYKKITKELITPYQQYNLHNGQNHRYTGAIWNQHNFAGGNAHDHWAVDNGGVLPPKSTAMLTNATSDNEYMLTKEHLKGIVGDRIYNISMNISAEDIDDISKVKTTLENLDKALNAGVQSY